MDVVNKVPRLKLSETVFIRCSNGAPQLYNVKRISKKPQRLFIIFEHVTTKVKLGIKIDSGVVSYSKFNKINGCEVIRNIISIQDADEFNQLTFENDRRVQVKLEKQFLLKKSKLSGLQVTSAHYKINKVKTTIKTTVKKYIKKLIEIDKIYKGFVELLNHEEGFPHDVHTTAQLFIDMYPTKQSLLETQQIINMEYRPILENLKNRNFHLTNIAPIVIDRKKIYVSPTDDKISIKNSNNLQNSFVEKYLKKFYSETSTGEGDIGDLALNLNIMREFAKGGGRGGSVKSYIDYIRKIYGNPSTNLETNINGDFSQDVSNKILIYDAPNLNYLTPDKSMIEHKYYPLNLSYTNDLFRLSHKSGDNISSACAVPIFTPDKKQSKLELTHKNGNQITKRKSTDAIYYFKDVFDDIKIGTTKTCNGTNKSGDIFYLGEDFKASELTKSQSVPPQKIPIYEGENVYVCGFYIKSPNNYKNLILGGHEQYDLKTNSKVYPSLFSNYKTVLDIDDTVITPGVKIIQNINNFTSTANYDPDSDYFILVGPADNSETRSKLTKPQWHKNLEKIAPTLQEIMSIIRPQLHSIKSVEDVEKLLNKYYFTFSKFPNTSYINEIRETITKNINLTQAQVHNHHKNSLNLKNQSDLMNTLYYKLKHSNGVDFKFLEFFNNYTIKTAVHKKLLAKLYTFLKGRPAPIAGNLEDLVMSLIKSKFIRGIKSYEIGRADQLNKLLNNIPKQTIKFQNISHSKIILEEVLDIINSKKGYLNREVLSNILELDNQYKIMEIIHNEEARYDVALEEHIALIEADITGLVTSYNNQRDLQINYLKMCKGVRVVKNYSRVSEINKDNGMEIYRDLKYDTLYYDLSILFNILQSPATVAADGNYSFKIVESSHVDSLNTRLEKNYIFMDIETITKKTTELLEFYENFRINFTDPNITAILDLLDNFDTSRKKQFASLTINGFPLRNKVQSDDVAFLVDGRKEFLFKRSGGVWHIITAEEFQDTPKAFIFSDRSILKLKSDELERLFQKINPSAVATEEKCINIDDYSIPIEIYRMLGDIAQKRDIVKNCKTIVKYKLRIGSGITNQLKTIESIFSKQQHRKQRFSMPHTAPLVRRKSPIPNSILLRYKDLFEGKDFDVSISKVIEFAETFGIDYCIADGCVETEKISSTAKFIYYNSSAFVFPICCKHELCFKDIALKTNTERAALLEKIKSDFGKTEEDRCICTSCGKDIDFLQGNAFEGFDSGNSLVVFREAVLREPDTTLELYEEDISIKNERDFYDKYQKSPEIMAIKYIISELGIKIIPKDLNYIVSKFDAISVSDLYKKFIKTDIIKKIMVKTYEFLKASRPKKSKRKNKPMAGGSNIDIKLKANILTKVLNSKFYTQFAKYPDGVIDISDLESVFSVALKTQINEFNLSSPLRPISIEDSDLLKNIGDINQLLGYLNKSSSPNGAIVLLLSNIQKLFNMYIRGFKFMHGLKYVTLLLQCSLPEYTINPFLMLSKIPALRASGKNYLIQNLYHNQEYIIESMFSVMENTLQHKTKSKSVYLNKIIAIFKNILGLSLKFAVTPLNKKKSSLRKIMFLNNLIIFEPFDIDTVGSKSAKLVAIKKYFTEKIVKELGDLVIQDPYIAELKARRVKHEYERSLAGGFTYEWPEFRPIINTESLNELNLDVMLAESIGFSSTSLELNAQLSKLSANYIYYINKLLNLIDADSTFFSYTTSTAFTNINFSFEDYFDITSFTDLKIKYPGKIDEDLDRKTTFDLYLTKIKVLLERMHYVNTIIGSKRREFTSPIYLLANNNLKTRDLQEYTSFEILSAGKPPKYFLNRIKKLFTTYYITDEQLLVSNSLPITKRRIFKTIKDPNHHAIVTLLERQMSHTPSISAAVLGEDMSAEAIGLVGEFNIVDEYMVLIGDTRNIIIHEILKTNEEGLVAENDIFFSGDSNGVYDIDILTGEFKAKINYKLNQKFGDMDSGELEAVIKIIEDKIHTIRPKTETATKFNDAANFKTNYLETTHNISELIKHIKVTNNEPVLAPVTELRNIVSFADIDSRELEESWIELNSLEFPVTTGYMRETVLNTLSPLQKTMFREIFERSVDKMNNFFVEKLREIEADLRIILFEENAMCKQLLAKEYAFYSEKQEVDKSKTIKHIFGYLLKFLIGRSLIIYRGYINSIQKDACADEARIEEDTRRREATKTSFDNDDISIIKKLYTSRYGVLCEPTHHPLTHLDQYTAACTGIIYLVGLVDSNIGIQYNIILLKDLIIKVLYLLNAIFQDVPAVVGSINDVFFEELSSIFETFKTNEYEIKNYMNIKKTKGNQNRKRKFDKKTTEDKLAHKLYRRFNLGKILDLSDKAIEEETTADAPEEPYEEGTYNMADANIDS